MRYGIKRWVTCYRFHRYQCKSCGAVFQPEEMSWGKSKFGSEIRAYSLYLNIELRLPQVNIVSKLNRLFDCHLYNLRVPSSRPSVRHRFRDLDGQVSALPVTQGVAQQFLNFLPLPQGQ